MTTTSTGSRTVLLARLGLAGGVLGVLQAIVLLAWPAQVGPDRFSYPQTPGAAAVTQVTFAVQHVLLLLGLLALLALARGRLLRIGLGAAAAGMVLITVVELLAIAAVGEAEDGATAGTVESLYSVPTILIGFGLVVAGIGALRGSALPGPRWLPLVVGAFVFVALVPALAAGPFTVSRIALGFWMLLFAWLFTAPARS